MKVPAPHFLLFSESSRKQRQGQWRFLLQAVDGTEQLEAADAEPEVQGERLELLAVVRGLEALDQPSRVTLVTPSKYVHRGVLYGLEEWRTNGWSWEHFGQMVPVKNRDLWQRLDNAMTVHELEFQPWRWDSADVAERQQPSTVAERQQPSAETMANATLAGLTGGVASSVSEARGPSISPAPQRISPWASVWEAVRSWPAACLDWIRLRLAIEAERQIPRLRVE